MPATYHMTMDLEKETKGTVRFKERTDPGERPHTFYLLKATFKDLGKPQSLDVEITPNEEE